MEQLSSATSVRRLPELLQSRVDDSVYVLDVGSGHCFSFRGPSARLWEMLADPVCAAGAASALVTEFDVEMGACTDQVTEHFRSLHREGLIVILDR